MKNTPDYSGVSLPCSRLWRKAAALDCKQQAHDPSGTARFARLTQPGSAGRLRLLWVNRCVAAIALVATLALGGLGADRLAAQEDLEKPPPIPPEDAADVPIPPKIQGEQIEPTVTIREEEDRRIEEYRFNGQVYMVKITPVGGVPYYYIDTDGDGKLELDMTDQALNPVQPVYWKIKEWK